MDKVTLLKQYFHSMDFSQIKLECKDYDFDFLDIISRLCTIDYITMQQLVHKYRLSEIPLPAYDFFLKMHIEQAGNVCGYFDAVANNVFCFNLDSTVKGDTDTITDEMQTTLWVLRNNLQDLEIKPLIVQSGRGFHVWCRLSESVPNEELADFIIDMTILTKDCVKNGHHTDIDKVYISQYPGSHNVQQNSLRLPGSTHVRNKTFSNIIHGEMLETVTEPDFWEYLESHMYWNTVLVDKFRESAKKLHNTYFNSNH